MKHPFIKLLAVIALVLLPGLAAWSQNTPVWLNADTRSQKYPAGTYYSGIAYETVSRKDRAEAIKKAEANARTEALSTISLSLHSTRFVSIISEMINNDEKISEIYNSEANIDVSFNDVPGLKVEHYVDGSEVTAFAYVKKDELARYYDRKITSLLTKIETTLDNADQFVSQGEKIRARELAETAVRNVAELEKAQHILLAVNSDADIQMDQYSTLSKRLVKTLSELKNATSIYLECKAFESNKPYTSLANDLKTSLSKLGVNFVNDKKLADWTITVNADVARTNNIYDTYFVWIDGDVSVLKNATGQVVYSGSISDLESGHPDGVKGGHTSDYHYAARAAYKEVSRILSEKLSELIKN